jgi:hypothetical protein
MLPKHPEARRFLEQKLFNNLINFRELEERINALGGESDKKLAFALFAEGLLATRSFPQAAEVLPAPALTTEICKRFSLPKKLQEADGYFRTSSGDTHPYSIHYCQERKNLGSDELAPFIQLIKKTEQPLLITNAIDLPRTLWKQSGFHRILAPDLDRLTPADFVNVNRWLKGGAIAPVRKTPSPSQTEGLNKVRAITENRAILVPHLGDDILQTARHLLENLGNKRTGLIILPTQSHIKDLIHSWRKDSSWSDITLLALSNQSSKLRPSDLDYPLTNSINELRQFFAQRITSGVKVLLSTDEIFPNIGRAILGFPPIDLALIMEAHKVATPQGERVRTALEDSDLPVKRIFLLTATPQRFDRLKANKEGEVKPLYNLNSDNQYGPVVQLGNLDEAIQKKTARPWKFLLPVMAEESDHLSALALCIENKPEISHIHTRHPKAAEASAFVLGLQESCPEALAPFTPFYVAGQKTGAEADRQIADYRHNSHALLALTTTAESGFAQPDADLIFFIQGAKLEESHTFTPVLRPKSGGQSGFIAIPIFKSVAEDWLERLGSADLWSSLQLFLEQDRKFAAEIRTIRINFGRTGNWDAEPLKQWLEIFAEPEIDSALLDAILIHCAGRLSTLWDENFGQLLAFRDQHKHCNIPMRWANNPQLSLWAEQQRKNWSKETLEAYRIKELDGIGFIWEPKKAAWEKMFKLLAIYKAQNNHCKVPKGWGQNPELADWVIRQRREYNNQRLEAEYSSRLSAMGFVWDLEVDAWETGFASLEKFYKIHNHAQISNPYPHNKQLGEWAEAQRRLDKQGKLTVERKERLDSLGFIWNLAEAAWEERFQLFERFREIQGHGKVGDRDKQLPKLSEWAVIQRREQSKGKLDPKRQQRLDDAGFVWDLEEARWTEMFALLKTYKLKHNHCTLGEKVWKKGSTEESLSIWSQEQRAMRRRGRLHPTRINRLNALGFGWDLKIAVWEQMFTAFRFFKLCHGHGKIPDRYPKNPALGQWAKTLRREWAMGSLDGDKKARLQEAGFVWDLAAAAWDENFARLLSFYKKEEHFSLPPTMKSDPELPGWVKKQRTAHSKNILKKEHRQRLEKIGFIWDVRKAAWEEMFVALSRFTHSRNHCIVPKKWPENPRLAKWVEDLRRDHKKDKIPQEQYERLSKLGFLWDAKAVFWEEMFVALTEYLDRHGDCLVPENYAENSELGWWVATQRKAKPSGQLDQARILRLDALEFIWDIADAHWLDMYRQLFNFYHKEGNCLVAKTKPQTMLLAAWCEEQRKAKAKNQLTQDHINRLSELNFIWDPKQVVVEEMLTILRAFKAEHEHCNVSTKDPKYSQLGLWLQFQRQAHKKGELDPLRKEKLEKVGFVLDPDVT